MCGIFGWMRRDFNFSVDDVSTARAAVGTMSHRGPDNQGDWTSTGIFLGHRRLSILDLSSSANQPFVDKENENVLVFNGEIYNYIELRNDLRAMGHRFQTDSDTEVLLAAFKQWGVDALLQLDGMFAGGWYDIRTGNHVIFRDALGQKPLYYYHSNGELVYASELRALLALPGFNWKIDKPAFARFLANSYYGGTDTPIEGISKLLPGCYLKVNRHRGDCQIVRYWNSLPGRDVLRGITEAEALDELERIFFISCQRSMRSDVPYGVFLSGGLDSTLILDICHQLNPDIHAYSLAMSDHDFDESAKAKAVVGHLGIRHHMFFSMDHKSVVDATNDVLTLSDEPHGDPGFVNSYLLASCVRQHIKVAIAGDGGDELFAGYAPFSVVKPGDLFSFLPDIGADVAKLTLPLWPESDRYMGTKSKIKAFLQGFPSTKITRLPLWLMTIAPEALAELVPSLSRNYFQRNSSKYGLLAQANRDAELLSKATAVQCALHYYQSIFLPEFVCMHTDRAAMLNSLEVRSPFLSPSIITYANRLPDEMKLHRLTLKWILRRLAKRRNFPSNIYRQRKQGFTFPVARWLKGPLKPIASDFLSNARITADGLMNQEVLAEYKRQHFAGEKNNYRILYNVMAFQAWRCSFPQVSSY